MDWLSQNWQFIVSLLIQTFIAYHIFFLQKRLSNQAKLQHKDDIQEKTQKLLNKIEREGLNSEVHLVNTKRYFKDYPSNDHKLWSGYSHLKAEVKSTRFNGVQFFSSAPVWLHRREDGKLSLKGGEDRQQEFKVLPVGVVPYEWIEHVDLEGNEYEGIPLFFCKFKGCGKLYWKGGRSWKRFMPWGYPYRDILYYKKSDVYHEGSDPADMEWRLVSEPVLNS